MERGVIPSSSVGNKINLWYDYIRRFAVPDAEVLRKEVQDEIHRMEENQDLLLYYGLMEFRHRLMLDYLDPLIDSDYRPGPSELLENLEHKQSKITGLLDYYYNFFQGMYEFDNREYIEAIKYYKNAEKALSFVSDEIEKAEFYFKIAELYYHMKQTYVSMYYAKQAYDIYKEQVTYQIRTIQCHFVLAGNFMDLNNYDQAMRHFEKAFEMSKKEQQSQLIGRSLFNKGLCFHNQEQDQAAAENIEKAVSVFEEGGIIRSLPQAYFLLAQIRFKHKDEQAEEAFKKGQGYAEQLGDSVYSVKFELLRSLYQSDPDDKGIEKSLLYLQSKKLYPDIEDLALEVAKHYSEQKNYKMATSYFLKVEEARKQTLRGDCLYEIEK
ncbi:aspartate phosphatase [Bacillus sp. z60-11]|uniref:response regulator aspartate phosphatase n=1 Tax=Bacillus sp. z60-11 TaxID=3377704 RepID=UPI00396C33A8